MVRNKNWAQIKQIIKTFEKDDDVDAIANELRDFLAPGDRVVVNIKRATIMNPDVVKESESRPKIILSNMLNGLRRVVPDARIVMHFDGKESNDFDTDSEISLPPLPESDQSDDNWGPSSNPREQVSKKSTFNKKLGQRVIKQQDQISQLEKATESTKKEVNRLRSIILMMKKIGVRDVRKSSVLAALSSEVKKNISSISYPDEHEAYNDECIAHGSVKALLMHIFRSCDHQFSDETINNLVHDFIDDWAIKWEVERRLFRN